MKNVKMETKGTVLTITVDLSKDFGPSGSGKSIILASTEGNQVIAGSDGVKMGLNVFKPVPKGK